MEKNNESDEMNPSEHIRRKYRILEKALLFLVVFIDALAALFFFADKMRNFFFHT